MRRALDKLDEFAFYAGELLNPSSGSKRTALIWTATNVIAAAFYLNNGDGIGATSPFFLYAAGFLTRRMAYNTYNWTRNYRRDYLSKGWYQLDKQICIAGNSLVVLGSLDMSYRIGLLALNLWAPQRPLSIVPTIVAGVGLYFGWNAINNAHKNLAMIKTMGGFRNLLNYRSTRAIDLSNG